MRGPLPSLSAASTVAFMSTVMPSSFGVRFQVRLPTTRLSSRASTTREAGISLALASFALRLPIEIPPTSMPGSITSDPAAEAVPSKAVIVTTVTTAASILLRGLMGLPSA